MKDKRTVSFSKNATNVFLHILTRCNLNCTHCYINPEQHGKEMVPIATIGKWLEAFSSESSHPNVIFLGGEPTLHPDLPEAVRMAKRIGYQSVTVDTNGFFIDKILSAVTPEELDYLSFSLDGATSEINDALRGKGCHQTCLAGIRKAVSAGFSTSLIFTVSRANVRELEKMEPLVADLGIKRFFIQAIGIRGKPAESVAGNLQVSRDEWLDTIPSAAEKIADHGIIVSYPKVFLDLEEPFECAGTVADNYFIFPNGRVYRCPLCEDFPIHGYVFDKTRLKKTSPINETDLFTLSIPEGCVMNKIVQPGNLSYGPGNTLAYRIACCMLKEEIKKS